jgi:transcription elongation factor Elf1
MSQASFICLRTVVVEWASIKYLSNVEANTNTALLNCTVCGARYMGLRGKAQNQVHVWETYLCFHAWRLVICGCISWVEGHSVTGKP